MEGARGKLLNSEYIVPFVTGGLALTLSTNVITTCKLHLVVPLSRCLTVRSHSAPRLPYMVRSKSGSLWSIQDDTSVEGRTRSRRVWSDVHDVGYHSVRRVCTLE